jgi:hypothetical protein
MDSARHVVRVEVEKKGVDLGVDGRILARREWGPGLDSSGFRMVIFGGH